MSTIFNILLFLITLKTTASALKPWYPLRTLICGPYQNFANECSVVREYACGRFHGTGTYQNASVHLQAMLMPRVLTNDEANQHNVIALSIDMATEIARHKCTIACDNGKGKIERCKTSRKALIKLATHYRTHGFYSVWTHNAVVTKRNCKLVNYTTDLQYLSIPNRVIASVTIAAYVFGSGGWRVLCPRLQQELYDIQLLRIMMGSPNSYEKKWLKYAQKALNVKKGRKMEVTGPTGGGSLGGYTNSFGSNPTPTPYPSSTPSPPSTDEQSAGSFLGSDTINLGGSQGAGTIQSETGQAYQAYDQVPGASDFLGSVGGVFGSIAPNIGPIAEGASAAIGELGSAFSEGVGLFGEFASAFGL